MVRLTIDEVREMLEPLEGDPLATALFQFYEIAEKDRERIAYLERALSVRDAARRTGEMRVCGYCGHPLYVPFGGGKAVVSDAVADAADCPVHTHPIHPKEESWTSETA